MIATPVVAQDAAPADDEEITEDENAIIVTGFRASLESAQNIKRDADTFVDAITAEDIGALPDRSVAEALQRVPGVNIGRFENPSDPDRFSVEGTGVVIRGLPFVRSELNGRDIFSATGGRVLSFNDVSPELLGRVEVFKNATSDMIDGGIAGTVNLVTRKPLDNPGLNLAGTIEGTIGDLAEELRPGFSFLGSNTWDTNAGTFGLQFGYAQSELVSRTDASQVTDPCFRAATLDGPCFRTTSVNSGGVGDPTGLDASNFPPAGTVIAPKGAGVRTTELERDREAYSAVAQFESADGSFLITAEYLRAETQFFTDETAILALVNDDNLFPVEAAGSTWQFDSNGVFQSGVLTQPDGGGFASPFGGIPTEFLRFQRGSDATTEDFSIDIDWEISDRFRVNFEAQSITSDLERNSIIGVTNTWTDIALDNTGTTPQVQFLIPQGAPTDYLSSGFYTYYWFLLDSIEDNEGDLESLRFDAEYDISDDGFFKAARFGARWAERDRTTRNTNFSTWGNLSAPWTGRAGCLPWGEGPNCMPGAPGTTAVFIPGVGQVFSPGFTPGRLFQGATNPDGTLDLGNSFALGGGAFLDDFPGFSQFRSPFADGFQRGNAPLPIEGGGHFFFGGDDFLGEYLAGTTAEQGREINAFSLTPNPFFGVQGRSFTNSLTGEVTQCDPFCPPEISDVAEVTRAAYGRIDYGADFDNGWVLEGNFGLRYVETEVRAGGVVGFPNGDFFDDPTAGGNGDGIVQPAEILGVCTRTQQIIDSTPDGEAGPDLPSFCALSAARQAEFAAAFTGDIVDESRDVTFDHFLPSFNAKLDVGDGLLFRFAVSRGISRPDLGVFTTGGAIVDNTGDLQAEGTLETGPLFQIFTGNRSIRPVESWNYDLSAEWYFSDVGSLTVSAFLKDIDGLVNGGVDIADVVGSDGTVLQVEVNGPVNAGGGDLTGFEIAHQQTYDFLPGVLSGLGSQFTYTYVDGGDFNNADVAGDQGLFVAGLPLAGISEHTINATVFYDYGPFSARAAYNWRSDFLITPRDSIFPFSPIFQESTGQLDASIFYSLTDSIKLGIQGVNLLDEVTRTSQVIDFDGTRITRSAFRNDRRFTFLARFDF